MLYGFNGKENDNEVKRAGNQQDYGMRIYDPRIAKFLSVDPLSENFPWFSTYQYAGNNPIRFIDLDGGEPKPSDPNYGQSVMIGFVNEKTLKDSYIAKQKHNGGQTMNRNWLGKRTNLDEGLAYIESLRSGKQTTTKLMNVVMVLHGTTVVQAGTDKVISTGFWTEPKKSFDESLFISGLDIMKFIDYKPLDEQLNKEIATLKAIFDQVGKGGNVIFSSCNLDKDPGLGKALQALSENRINIYVTADLVRLSGLNHDGINVQIEELIKPRILDSFKEGSNYNKGFILYPEGGGEPQKLNKNISLGATGKAVNLVNPLPKKNKMRKLFIMIILILPILCFCQIKKNISLKNRSRVTVHKLYPKSPYNKKNPKLIHYLSSLEFDSVKIFTFNCKKLDWNSYNYKIDSSKLYFKKRRDFPFYEDGKRMRLEDINKLVYLLKNSYKDDYPNYTVTTYAPTMGIAFFNNGGVCAHVDVSNFEIKTYITFLREDKIIYKYYWISTGEALRRNFDNLCKSYGLSCCQIKYAD